MIEYLDISYKSQNKKMKDYRFIKVVILLIFVGVLTTTCSRNTSHKIGFMLPSLMLDRFAKEREFFITKVRDLGGEVIVTEAQNSDQLQISQAHDLFIQGVEELVIMAVNNITAAAIVRDAHDHNVKVIAYERIISNCDLDYFITFDNVKVGELMATYALKHKPKGTYALFGGDKTDQNAVWVKRGLHNIIDPYIKSGQICVVYDTYIEDWSGENAKNEMETFLNLSCTVPDVVLSSNDGMALGIIEALEAENVCDFPIITGQDAELSACQNIVRRKQSVTIYKSLKQEAETAAVLAMECAKNEKIKTSDKNVFNGQIDVATILITPQSVDIYNLEKTVIGDGFLSKNEVFCSK